MKPYCRFGYLCWKASLVITIAILGLALPAQAERPKHSKIDSSVKKTNGPQQIVHYHLDDAHTRAGFEHFYNLEYDKAIREFEAALETHPNDPFAVNHLLSGVMFKEMYRIGAMDSELYAKEGFLHSKQYPV